eukprot:TRINITY_DN4430_c0_g1_i2.p1 TRINITY_DN4430_c0_g1~~TRINITY_DN4430_c0_g1_i2.p1  ORF type:complete len:175 (-),score=40.63 TRINITY_DN4430_c0_g1_i2:366-890(-)
MQDLISPSPAPTPAATTTATTTATTAASAAATDVAGPVPPATVPPVSNVSSASLPITNTGSQDTLFTTPSPETSTDTIPSAAPAASTGASTSARVSDVPGMGKVQHDDNGGISFNLPAMDARDMFPKSQSFEMDKRHSAADLISDAILESYTPKVKISEEELDLIKQQTKGPAS